jgi:Ca-activated chloride channel family protein
MKIRIIIIGLVLLCFGISQIEDVPKSAKKVTQEESVLEESPSYDEELMRSGLETKGIQPQPLKFKAGRSGWKVQIPGNRPLATVAYEDGLIFVGGGYGSYEFYALEAKTGKLAWMFKTGDDGPTAAVVRKGYVVFNTESCIIYVLRAKTGEKVWEKWLGDPLMSQPAIDDEYVYGSVYITCFDGTVYRHNTKDGKLVWSQKKQATCAPTIYNNRIFVSLRQELKDGDKIKQYEGMATLDDRDGEQQQKELWSKREAPYLAYGRPVIKNGYSYNAMGNEIQALDVISGKQKWSKKYDDLSEEGIGGRVFSPPSYANKKLFLGSGSGDVFCLREKDGKVLWKEKVDASISFQPAVAHGMVFISCDNGMLYGINTGDAQDDGWYMWGGNSEHNK